MGGGTVIFKRKLESAKHYLSIDPLILHYSNARSPLIQVAFFSPQDLELLQTCVFSLFLVLKFVIFYDFILCVCMCVVV